MKNNSRPLIPVDPKGLEDVAADLLKGSHETNQVHQTVLNLEGFVYVPSVNLYFAKERSLQGLNWEDTHKKVLGEGLGRMPTPKETWELILYAKANLRNSQLKQIYDDVLKLTPAKTWHGEWQNVKFSKENNGMYFQRVTGLDSNGELIYSGKEKLETCLMEDCWADFSSANKQGLLTRKDSGQSYDQGKNIYFWYPRDGAVARFVAVSDGAGLGCDGGPTSSNTSLGVRLVREATPPKNGGNKK